MGEARANCRGSIGLGNNCGMCPKCKEHMKAPAKSELKRTIKERDQLAEKLEKLKDYLADNPTSKVGRVPTQLLQRQRDIMADYIAVLDARIEIMETLRGES